jgi:hypothetical protein
MPDVDSALVYENVAAKPGTHVILIGIGTYRYLIGGEDENPDTADEMGQLDAPPKSVKVLADWFLDHFENPERPLASLALVVSADAPVRYAHGRATAEDHDLPRGTVPEIKAAVRAWNTRASVHRGNQTIFFFCGHGLFSGSSVLIARDFGETMETRFDEAVNLDDFLAAMLTMQPDNQVFVVDACRTPAALENALIGRKNTGDGLLSPVPLAARGGSLAKQSVHLATSTLAPSYGRTDGISIYTDALIRALSGGGAQSDLDWWIGTNGLQTALAAYTARIARKYDVAQEPDRIRSGQFKVHQPTSVKVPIYVTCHPAEVWGECFRIDALLDNSVSKSCAHDPVAGANGEEVELSLDLERYEIKVCFGEASQFGGGAKKVLAVPPEAPCCIPIEMRT